MSQTAQVSEQQKVLLMERQVSLKMEEIIPRMMEDLADKYELQKVREKSPFRNVLNVSTELGSGIEVTKNFIRYQLGRSGANRMWKESKGDKNFAVALVDAIEELEKDVADIIGYMQRELGIEQLESSWQRRVHRRLMQLYLGNLARYQTYLANEKGGT